MVVPLVTRRRSGDEAPVNRRLSRLPRAALACVRVGARGVRLRGRQKILYALTPPPSLSNVGDHAQVVAIRAWLARHHSGLPVLEVDKRESLDAGPVLSRLVGPEDLIYLHSGGNLGDRGLWSETARRSLIARFPDNAIVSLPQTIYFSDTDDGRRQRAITERVYGAHPRLTVIGRDPESHAIANAMFPSARTLAMPDFVLSLPPREPRPRPAGSARVLLCLRRDAESVLGRDDVESLRRALAPDLTTSFDTTLAEPIPRSRRHAIVEETLDLFSAHDAVITDRYHGLIFAVLCRRPCVALPTVDHKLTSAMHWFEGVPFVRMVERPADAPSAMRDLMAQPSDTDRGVPDWNAEYFDRIPDSIGAP